MQLLVTHWNISVALLIVVDNLPHKLSYWILLWNAPDDRRFCLFMLLVTKVINFNPVEIHY